MYIFICRGTCLGKGKYIERKEYMYNQKNWLGPNQDLPYSNITTLLFVHRTQRWSIARFGLSLASWQYQLQMNLAVDLERISEPIITCWKTYGVYFYMILVPCQINFSIELSGICKISHIHHQSKSDLSLMPCNCVVD